MAIGREPSGDPTEASNDEQRSRQKDPEAHDSDNQGDEPPSFDGQLERPQSIVGEALFIAVVCCAQLLTQAGLAMTIVPSHIIGRSFGVNDQPAVLSWFSAGYSLTVGTLILIAGRLGDVFGHKPLFVSGYVWFGLWSLIAGVAVYSSSSFFIFCRTMQGIGPAFLLPNGIAMIGRSYEPGLRQNLIFCLFGAMAPIGFVLGAVFSSLLGQLAWWPWSYWILCIVCLLLAVLAMVAVPVTPAPSSSEPGNPSIWQRVDIFGCITGVAALVLFNFGWNQGPAADWAPYTYSIIIVGIVVFALFVFVEKRVTRPLIPFGVLHVDSFFTLACISAGWGSFGIYVLYALQLLEVLRQQSALVTAAQFTPIVVSGLLAAGTTGLILRAFRPSTVILISMTFFLTGGIIFATVPVGQTYWAQTFVAIVILPWGMDMSFPAATIILSRAMPRQHQGLAASLVTTFVNYSISLGLGMAGTVEGQVNNSGRDILQGYRGAFYLGVSLSALGVALALLFGLLERHRSKTPELVAGAKGEGTESSI